MFSTTDTIVAEATPPGRGGIGVVRLSGAGALEIADADGDVVDHERFTTDIETSFRGASKTRTRNLEIPDMVLRTIPE